MNLLEGDLRRMTDDFRRLREDMLPALRLVKDAQAPLPNVSSTSTSATGYSYDSSNTLSPQTSTSQSGPGGLGSSVGSVNRQYSQRKILIGAAPKNASPTQTTHERSIAEQSIDPAGAAERAVLSSTHLAAMNGSGPSQTSPAYPSPNQPSPTSPHNLISTLGSRSYRNEPPPLTARSDNDHGNFPDRSKAPSRNAAPQRRETPVPDTPGGSSSNASVEIFKSFRVSMDDPCHKVLPAALKKYQINAPWDQYALYIVYGDQERCLGMDEKPLILFKQLDKEGKKPMFMLRKTNAASGDGDPGTGGSSGRGGTSGYDPPGGII